MRVRALSAGMQIPDGVAAHLLSKGGCDCPDERTCAMPRGLLWLPAPDERWRCHPRSLRLASAAAQNLVLQIAVDAWDYRKLRMERRPDEAVWRCRSSARRVGGGWCSWLLWQAPKMLDRESIVLRCAGVRWHDASGSESAALRTRGARLHPASHAPSSCMRSLRELGIDAQLCDALRADPLPEPE